jgi:hypothetical protein
MDFTDKTAGKLHNAGAAVVCVDGGDENRDTVSIGLGERLVQVTLPREKCINACTKLSMRSGAA